MELSTKLKKFYFFNCKTKNSQYEWPAEAAADFAYVPFYRRILNKNYNNIHRLKL